MQYRRYYVKTSQMNLKTIFFFSICWFYELGNSFHMCRIIQSEGWSRDLPWILEISKTLSFHWVLCKLPYADEHIGENKNLQILKALTYFLLLSIFGPVTENGKMWSRNPSPWSDIPWRRKNCYRLVIKSTMTGFCWPRSPILSWSSPMIVL